MTVIAAALLISLLAYIGATQDNSVCPPYLQRDIYLQAHGDYCYQFVVYRQDTHSQAKSQCEHYAGNLVAVRDEWLQNYLFTELMVTYKQTSSKIWIGLNDVQHEGQYLWEDGERVAYSNWADGQGPDDTSFAHALTHGDRDCVVMDTAKGGKWEEVICDSQTNLLIFVNTERHPYICQYKIMQSTTADWLTTSNGISTTRPRTDVFDMSTTRLDTNTYDFSTTRLDTNTYDFSTTRLDTNTYDISTTRPRTDAFDMSTTRQDTNTYDFSTTRQDTNTYDFSTTRPRTDTFDMSTTRQDTNTYDFSTTRQDTTTYDLSTTGQDTNTYDTSTTSLDTNTYDFSTTTN